MKSQSQNKISFESCNNKDASEGSFYNVYYTQKKYSPENKFPYEGSRYKDYFRDIPFYNLKKILKKNNIDLNDRTVLVASSGSGIDGFYLKKCFNSIKLFFSDINLWGMEKVRSNFQREPAVLTNNYCLAFKDNSFDYVFISTSLHHLRMPLKGIYELLRVAKQGLIVIEPNDSWLTMLFQKFGWIDEYENGQDHFNYVYRLNKRDVEKISKALYFKYSYEHCFAIHKIAKTNLEFLILKFLNGLANIICPHQGNFIIFLIKKELSIPEYLRENKSINY